MVIVLKIIILLAGLLLPTLCGAAILDLLEIHEGRTSLGHRLHRLDFEGFILSFLLGWGIFPAIFACLGFIGMPLNLQTGVLLLVAIYVFAKVAGFARSDKRAICLGGSPSDKARVACASTENIRTTPEGINSSSGLSSKIRYLLVALSISLFTMLFLKSVSDTDSYPLQGVWGYKAMVIYHGSTIPPRMLISPELGFTHQSYPLEYPLMLSWTYMCIGEFNDSMVKLVPTLLGLFVFLSLYSIINRETSSRNLSIFLALAFCTCDTFVTCSTILYADNLLFLYVIWGVYMLFLSLKPSTPSNGRYDPAMGKSLICIWDRRNKDNLMLVGIMLLAMSCQVKNEGAIYFGAAALFMVPYYLVRRDKEQLLKFLLYSALCALLFVLPWIIIKYYFDIHVRDFDIARARALRTTEVFSILKLGLLKIIKIMFLNIRETGGLWYFIAILLTLNMNRFLRGKCLLVFPMAALIPIFIFWISFLFSNRDLQWHMEAFSRLLFIPMGLLFLSLSCIIKPGALAK